MKRPAGNMTFNQFKQIIDQIPTLKTVGLYFMGEPLLNPEVFSMIEYAEQKGIKTSIETNSTLLYKHVEEIFESGLSKLVCSLDGMTQKSLEQYRAGAHYNQTVGGIKNICISKHSKPHVKIRFLTFRHNEKEMEQAKKFAEQIRPDEFVFVRSILDWGFTKLPENRKQWLPTDKNLWRYLENGSLKNPLSYCTWIWTPIITWDGNVIPCCYDYDAYSIMGNVFEQPFMEIYWSRGYRTIRKKMMQKSLSLCKFCKQVKQPEIN